MNRFLFVRHWRFSLDISGAIAAVWWWAPPINLALGADRSNAKLLCVSMRRPRRADAAFADHPYRTGTDRSMTWRQLAKITDCVCAPIRSITASISSQRWPPKLGLKSSRDLARQQSLKNLANFDRGGN